MEKRMHRHSIGDDITPDMVFDPLDPSMSFKPSPAEQMLRFDTHQIYRRFDRSDLVIILGVFLMGFFLSFSITSYYRAKKAKLEQIN